MYDSSQMGLMCTTACKLLTITLMQRWIGQKGAVEQPMSPDLTFSLLLLGYLKSKTYEAKYNEELKKRIHNVSN